MKTIFSLLFFCLSIVSISAQPFYQTSPAASRWVDSVFSSLTPQQRIAQLMVVRLSEKTATGVAFYDDKVEKDIRNYNIGSVCLFQGSPVQQAQFINRFQSIAQTPILFCIDGETGLGMRIDSIRKFPDQLTIGAISDTNLVYEIGKAIGKQCKRIGIQVDYAPVVDINNNANNPVINFRSFGQDKYKVGAFGVQMMKGMQSSGTMACAKHFPGHGDVAVDSHFDLPVIAKTVAELDSLELYPFKQLFDAGVGSVMIAHLAIPSIDNTPHLPTSLSQKNVTGLLRNELHFNGISFTDALEMKGVAKYFPQGEAAVQSLIAGNDMLCLPGDISECIAQISKALSDGRLQQSSVDNSVKKVLLAKYNLRLTEPQMVHTKHLAEHLNEEVDRLRKEVARKAITLLRLQNEELLPLSSRKKVAYVGFGITGSNTFAAELKKKYNADAFFVSYKDNAAGKTDLVRNLQKDYDAVVIGLHGMSKYPGSNFGLSSGSIELLNELQKNNKSITLLFGNPYAVKNMCAAPNLMVCYEDDDIFQKQAFKMLTGNHEPKGTLPVTVCSEYPFGSGIVMNE